MSLQNLDWKADHRFWCGCSGTGKTTHFLKTLRAEKARVKFVFDHQGELARKLGFAPCFTPEQLSIATATAASGKGGYVIFDPVRSPLNLAETFLDFCTFAFAVGSQIRGRKILCCDELGKITDNQKEPDRLVHIFQTGRRNCFDTFCIGQGANEIHNKIRNQWTQIYAFRQADSVAIGPLKIRGFDETTLLNLKPFEYEWRNLNTGESSSGRKKV